MAVINRVLEPELVITAPEPHGAALAYATRCRSTLGVLAQLFAEARERVIFASPFVQPHVLLGDGALAMALGSALGRKVTVDILIGRDLLNRPEFRDFVRRHATQIRIFDPTFPSFDVTALGSYAKFCIRDGEAAYIGSANLTGPGLHEHFEMGVLVYGKIAAAMQDFWDFAVRNGLFVEIRA
jgi:phosphatidylserine/phosphatidylglycerophosphate/cardiolipin synthase-like enzyme